RTFSESVVGRFSSPKEENAGAATAANQALFQVELRIQQAQDQCLLTIRRISDGDSADGATHGGEVIVDQIPVALNGWNPPLHPEQGIYFDARPGSHAVIDDLELVAPDSESPLLRFDFESPLYVDGGEVVGVDGWESSSLGAAGSSLVSAAIGDVGLQQIAVELRNARLREESIRNREDALRLQITSHELQVRSLEKRHEAERLLHAAASPTSDAATDNATVVAAVCDEALQLHHKAAVLKARAEIASTLQQLAAATTKAAVAGDAKQDPVAELNQQLSSARSSLAAAETAATTITAFQDLPPLGRTYPQQSTGRRAALARWIAGRENPLTARVAVNHLWMRHFHSPLVSTVFDFGRNGTPPTHPDLLDWLASELMESGWSMKHMHRLILTSETWRQVSEDTEAGLSVDPENRLLGHMNRTRMESEVVRDSLLFCGGRLDLTMGGQELENSQALTTFRRSLYYSCHPESDGRSEFGSLFDAPSPADCYRRTKTIVPQQALALTNNQLVHDISADIAKQLVGSTDTHADNAARKLTEGAFRRILCRAPLPDELRACGEFLQSSGGNAGAADETPISQDRVAGLVRVLLNHNDFVTVR
ncbi:MAG: DUF1553 domain-containing protein, partial [Planctomycetaceae bacterium]|nr:DUF1553 domain-containing protein [Planctomycetaceae bacterium]